MRILITNDDGISSPALKPLAEWARGLGEVTVIAPKVEQSGMSHAIDFQHPMEIKRVDLADGVEAYSLDSTPADCVRYGVLGMHRKYDLIISGINRGFNLGADLVYSGTVGAIFEAARLDTPGIALSASVSGYVDAVAEMPRLWSEIEKRELLSHNSWYNINIPDAKGELSVTRQGGIFYTDRFVRTTGDLFVQEGEQACFDTDDLTVDIDATLAGCISVTPLLPTRTNLAVFEVLKNK